MLAHFVFTETSPAAPSTVASSQPVQSAASYLPAGVAGPIDDADSIDVIATLRGATGGALDVYLQTSADEGQSWSDAIHFAQLAGNAAAVSYRVTLSAVSQPLSAAPTLVGMGLTPALAVNTVLQGVGFNRARLVFVAGSGTTAGASQSVQLTSHRPNV